VPDEARFGVEVRTVKGFGAAETMAALKEIAGDEVTFTRVTSGEPGWVDPAQPVWTDPAHPWVQSVFDLIADITGVRHEAAIAPYFTDAGALSQAFGRPPTLILGPGEPEMAHQTDGYCLISRLEEGTAAFTEIARRWCGI
jgi:succinyl-diaminopimelate desuccinylase